MSMMSEFKDFAMKGNVVDMAVGIVIGGAFGKIVSSFVADVLMPPIGLLLGGVDFSDLAVTLRAAADGGDAVLMKYGVFIQTVVDFVIIAFAIFMVVKAMNSMKKKEAAAPAAPPAPEQARGSAHRDTGRIALAVSRRTNVSNTDWPVSSETGQFLYIQGIDMRRRAGLSVSLLLYACCPSLLAAQTSDASDSAAPLNEITVNERPVANDRPAGTFATPISQLRFDPATELQSRGLPEGQADVAVRGGLFENTGFKVGAVTVTDPQTGHYAAELPIDPALLSAPMIRTGIDNSLTGFNSNIATIAFSLPAMREGGSALLGAGSDKLNFQTLRFATVAKRERP